MSTVYFYAKNY